MEICPFPARFPAATFQSGHLCGNFVLRRSSRPSSCSFATAAGSNYSADTAKLATPNRMFILGMGFVGQFFAQDLKNRGWVVSGTCTSNEKKDKLEKMGLNVHVFDANEPELDVLNILNQHTHLLISIPTRVGIGDPMLQHGELLRQKLDSKNIQWLGYLSSTSVYGDCGGEWVDESYQPSPSNEVAKMRLAAEEGWLRLGHDIRLAAQVFRLGGIYGPGRSAIDTITKQGRLSETQNMRSFRKYTSRVHVADICNALNASLHKPSPGRIYNIVDDEPAPRSEVFSFALDLIREKWPGLVKQVASSEGDAESFMRERSSRGEKRVSNGRMKKELGVKLTYPDYRAGLQSIINQMHDPSFCLDKFARKFLLSVNDKRNVVAETI